MVKSPDAFRTISEVADWLGVQAHVLRFWESKFSQVKPIKRAGGRRYYRPSDMLLIGGIKKLLHEDGMTIKGAQKLLRENGVAYVADMSQPLDDLTIAVIEGQATPVDEGGTEHMVEEPGPAAAADTPTDAPEQASDITQPAPSTFEDIAADDRTNDETGASDFEELSELSAVAEEDLATDATSDDVALADASAPMDSAESGDDAILDARGSPTEPDQESEPEEAPVMPSFRSRARMSAEKADTDDTVAPNPVEAPAVPNDASVEDFPQEAPPVEATDASTTDAPSAPPRPRAVDVPAVPLPSEIKVDPSALAALIHLRSVSPEQARQIRPLLARLTRLRASIASPRKEISKD
ncbi:MAG: MerR family transcriptional regulator [Pseudomonadota bacterium]